MLPSPPNQEFIIEYVKDTKITFYCLPTDEDLLAKVRRFKLVNCSCPAYARERQRLTSEISEAITLGLFDEIPQNIVKTNYPVLRILA